MGLGPTAGLVPAEGPPERANLSSQVDLSPAFTGPFRHTRNFLCVCVPCRILLLPDVAERDIQCQGGNQGISLGGVSGGGSTPGTIGIVQ